MLPLDARFQNQTLQVSLTAKRTCYQSALYAISRREPHGETSFVTVIIVFSLRHLNPPSGFSGLASGFDGNIPLTSSLKDPFVESQT